MGIALTHFIWSEWVKNLSTSILAFDISQFFPSLNYQLLPLIIDKAELNCKGLTFFKNYLVGRKTKYLWNNFLSLFCSIDVSVRQESALSLIFSALYLFHIFYILEKHLKNLKIPILIIYLSMTVSLFLRTNLFLISMQIFFVVTM